MAGYILYVKGANSTNAKEHLERWGLGDLGFDELMAATVQDGPNLETASGAFCSWMKGNPNDPKMVFSPLQTWLPLPENGARAKGDVWIGFEPGRPVRPVDVARKQMMSGCMVTLRDGMEWLIPAAQQLPRTLGLGDDGEIQREVESRYKGYYDRAFHAMQEVFRPFGMWNDERGFTADIEPNDEVATVTIEDGTKLACEALSINYRLNYELALMLGLLDERCLIGIIACTFDMPEIFAVEQQKKKIDVVSIPATSLI